MWETLKALFAKPKTRVRKLDLNTGLYIFGTVEKTMQTERPHCPNFIEYWSIVWDDAPAVWITVPSMNFLWHDGVWTHIER